jgi:hypothetical protein
MATDYARLPLAEIHSQLLQVEPPIENSAPAQRARHEFAA